MGYLFKDTIYGLDRYEGQVGLSQQHTNLSAESAYIACLIHSTD